MENKPLEIVYQDDLLVAINKPGGLAVQPDKTNKTGLIQVLKQQLQCELYLVHRLDRPVSGVLLFAKKKWALTELNKQFQDRQVVKRYWAVVQEKPENETGTLTHYLRKDQAQNRSFAFDKPLHHTREAVLEYRFLGSIERYHLLEIDIQTGRHHQIRAQLNAIGSPVKGDVKYGFRRGNRDRSIHLHAFMLSFVHPDSEEKIVLNASVPDDSVWNAFAVLKKK